MGVATQCRDQDFIIITGDFETTDFQTATRLSKLASSRWTLEGCVIN